MTKREEPKEITSIIPASPGWFVLEIDVDGNGDCSNTIYIPIIAWVVKAEVSNYTGQSSGYTYPITSIGLIEEPMVVSPSGIFTFSDSSVFKNEKDAIAYMAKEIRNERIIKKDHKK